MLGRWMHFNHSFFSLYCCISIEEITFTWWSENYLPKPLPGPWKMTPRICTPRFWYHQVSNLAEAWLKSCCAASSFNGIRQKIARISTKEIMRFFLYRKLPFSSATYQPGEFKFQHTEFKATMMIDQFLDAKWPPLSSLCSPVRSRRIRYDLLPFRAADMPGHCFRPI